MEKVRGIFEQQGYDEGYICGQDDYQEWLWMNIAQMRKSGLYDLATLEELEQRTY